MGDVDEANSAIGVALLHVADRERAAMLRALQNELFDLGADLATPGDDFAPGGMALRIVQPQIDRLEREIDALNKALAPLRSFILPGGSPPRPTSTSPAPSSAAPNARPSPLPPRFPGTRWR